MKAANALEMDLLLFLKDVIFATGCLLDHWSREDFEFAYKNTNINLSFFLLTILPNLALCLCSLLFFSLPNYVFHLMFRF